MMTIRFTHNASPLPTRPRLKIRCQCSRTIAPSRARFRFRFGYANIPHPAKADYGGEDAFFVSEITSAIGVADGVGGWAEDNVNPAEYSRMLMDVAQMHLEGRLHRDNRLHSSLDAHSEDMPSFMTPSPSAKDETATNEEQAVGMSSPASSSSECTAEKPSEPLTAQGALAAAHRLTRKPGSATACVLRLDADAGSIDAANLGDSGFLVIRGGNVAFQSPIQQHFFDCPYQLGAAPEYVPDTDSAEDAALFNVPLQPGDAVVLATDGLLDNVWPEDIALLAPRNSSQVESAAVELAELASVHASDPSYGSPYAAAAAAAEIEIPFWEKLKGISFVDGKLELGKIRGGKVDDITVVVAYVEENKETRESAMNEDESRLAPGTPSPQNPGQDY